jgi:hypothetical protein
MEAPRPDGQQGWKSCRITLSSLALDFPAENGLVKKLARGHMAGFSSLE